jgi:amidase
MIEELIEYDAMALGELVRKGEISPVELLETTVQKIEELNPKLNAVIHKIYDQARESAESWNSILKTKNATEAVFCGVPFLLKDLLAECKGTSFVEGSRAVKGYISKLDSELVRRQKISGLIIVGKTNTPEFGAMPTTEPALCGPSKNPWDPGLTPGGSSGGSAAAVAAGIVPMAHGNDGGGSIRIPASCCAVFGLKPSRGRNPLGPLFGDIASGIVYEHALTRTVRDSAALLDVTSGPDIGDPYRAPRNERPFLEEVGMDTGRLKIGFLAGVPQGWHVNTELHPDCVNAVKDAAQLCSNLGHIVEKVTPNDLSYSNVPQIFSCIFSGYIGHVISYWERELGRKIPEDELEPVTWARHQTAKGQTCADYLVAIEKAQRFTRKLARWHNDDGYDLLLSPTMRIPPTKLGALQWTPENPEKWIALVQSFGTFTRIQNLTGQPAMSVPLFWNAHNIPIGVQFAGRFGDEATLFRLASQLELARPWADKKPFIHCSNVI